MFKTDKAEQHTVKPQTRLKIRAADHALEPRSVRGNDKAKRLNKPAYRAVEPPNAFEYTPYYKNRGVDRKER